MKWTRFIPPAAITAIIGWSTLTPALAQDAYLCVTDGIAGFGYSQQTKQWVATTFPPSGRKYIFRRAKEGQKSLGIEYKWGLFLFGSDDPEPLTICQKDFDFDRINCPGSPSFSFNRKNLRYQNVSSIGYVTPLGGDGANTPYMEIGKCSPL
jgi:hypothetical protein